VNDVEFTKITPEEMWQRFSQRDDNAIQDMNNWLHGPVTESRRLAFVEGRLTDACILLKWIMMNWEPKR
jgi:hypothetical protein